MKSCMFVVPSLSDGGAERVVSVLSSELSKRVEKVCVLIYWDTEQNYPVSSNVKIINLSGGNKRSYDQMKTSERLKKMRSIIKREQPEIVIPFLPHVCLQMGIATIGLNCNVIQTVRNNPKTSPPEANRRKIRDLQIFMSKCTIVQNEEQLNYFPKNWRNKIHILPNPINESFLKTEYKGSGSFKAVSVGRLIEQKNFPLLIDAFSEFVRKHPDATLSIYGDGALKNVLHEQIVKNGMSDNIFLKGRSDNLPEILASSSVFIMSSDFEGMPNSLMEAMAVGIPVISTDCPTGPKELIGNNERGYLIEIGNQEVLRKAIETVKTQKASAQEKALKAKVYVQSEFSPEEIANKFIEICDNYKELKG